MKNKVTIGDDGDIEVLCEHGIGHSKNVHTCDGCCSKIKDMTAEVERIARMVSRHICKGRTSVEAIREERR